VSILSTLKSVFLPSDTEADIRRQKYLGTSSETGAALIIAGGAGVLAAAPALIPYAVSSFAGATTKTKLITAAAAVTTAPAITGIIARDPTVITRAPALYADLASSSFDIAKNPSKEKLAGFVSEHPVASGTIIAGAALLGGTIVAKGAQIYSNIKTAESIEDIEQLVREANTPNLTTIPAATMPTAKNGLAPVVPITPATQVAGKAASTGTRKSYKRRKTATPASQSVRVNILNALGSKLLTNKNYISNRRLTY